MQDELQYNLLNKILGLQTSHPFKQETKLDEAINYLPGFKEACEKFNKICPQLSELDFEAFSDVVYSYFQELTLALIKAKIIKVSFLNETL